MGADELRASPDDVFGAEPGPTANGPRSSGRIEAASSTVSRLPKGLLYSGLLVSHRGTNGGYVLARVPREISVLEIIAAFEGLVAHTECSTEVTGLCDLESSCPIKNNQRVINEAVRGVLGKITLSDLMQPLQLAGVKNLTGKLVPIIRSIPGRIQ